MNRYKSKRGGQALVELAFILPFLLLVIANVVNFGGMFFYNLPVNTFKPLPAYREATIAFTLWYA